MMSAVEGRKRIRPDHGLPLSSFPPEEGSPSKRASSLRLPDFPSPRHLPVEASPANSASPDLAFLEDLCDASALTTAEEECLLAEMMRSLEKEIVAPVAVGALVSPEESLRQLFEASDDELGLPSTSISTGAQWVADLCSISSAAEDLSSVASALLADVAAPASHQRSNVSGGCSGEGDCAASVGAVYVIARDYLYEDIVALDGCL